MKKIKGCKLFYMLGVIFFALLLSDKQAIAGTVLVSNVWSNSVSLIDENTLLPVKEIKVGYMPHEVIVTSDGKTALVSSFGDLLHIIRGHVITSIDVANAKVLQTIKLPKKSRPHGLALLSESQVLVTVQGMQSLLVVDFVKGTIIKTIALPGAGAHMVLTDEAKQWAYVANTNSGSVSKINLKDFAVVGEVKIGKEAQGLALTPQEDLLLVTNRKDNLVAVIRTKDLTIQKKIKTASGPVRVVMFDSGRSALVTNSLSGNAQVIDMATLSISKTFNTTRSHSVLPAPINVAVREDQRTAYITNSLAGNVTLVDLVKGEILKTFKAGHMPDGVALTKVIAIDRKGV